MSVEHLEQKLKNFGSKLWRLNNLYSINDKNGKFIKLKLNAAQIKILTEFKHNKKIILKSRQQGVTTLFCAYNLDSCLFKPNYSAGIQSYGLTESHKLQQKVLFMWNSLDEEIKKLFNLELVTNNSNGMAFNNGSTLRIGNFRGDTLQSLHVSELAKIAKRFPEKAYELQTGAFQAIGKDNRITIESTAEGRGGLFYEMWQKAITQDKTGNQKGPFDFEPIFLSWLIDPDCNLDIPQPITEEYEAYFKEIEETLGVKIEDQQKWWYISKKEGELGDFMKQEYPSTAEEAFNQTVKGTYYATEYRTLNIKHDTFDPTLPVHMVCDLGMSDTFSILFFQLHGNGKTYIIGEYENSGEGLEHYRDMAVALSNKYGWTLSYRIYVPHDIKVKELIAAKTRFDALRDLGLKPILVKKHKLADGIEQTRHFLKEVVIDSKCQSLVIAIQNYRKVFNRQYNIYLDTPVHDEFSHIADALRYLAMGLKHRPIEYTLVHYGKSYSRNETLGNRDFDI